MRRTITAGLHRRLNVTNALDRNTILVIAIYKLVLKFADLIDEDTEFVCDVRHIIVASFTPDGQLLLNPISTTR
jgi:hypothetical protein